MKQKNKKTLKFLKFDILLEIRNCHAYRQAGKLEIKPQGFKQYLSAGIAIFLMFFMPFYEALALVPNDAGYSFQWYLEKINAPEAWDITTGSSDTIIAFIDSGIDITHPDLKKNIWVNMDEIDGDEIDNDHNGYVDDVHGWNFVESNNNVTPAFESKCLDRNGAVKESCKLGINHGTIVAGIAAAVGNNKKGIAGIVWNSKIMPLKALDGTGHGQSEFAVEAINYAINNGANIINLSLVGETYSQELENALQTAYEKGIAIVAAAGNNEGGGVNIDKYPKYPVCYNGKKGENIIIGVAGTDRNDDLAAFSNFGKNCIDVVAPAVNFYSTSVYNPTYEGFEDYYDGPFSGTSIAASIVSGLAALIKSARPALSNNKIYDLIINNSDAINSSHINAGRVNLLKILQFDFKGNRPYETYIIATGQAGKEAIIRQFRSDGVYLRSFSAYYEEEFTGGISIASGDVYGNGEGSIIAAKSYGDFPEVRVFDYSGNLKSEFFVYGKNFKGGVNVASGDVDGDGIDEIITGAGFGGGPHIRIFDADGNIKSQFFAYAGNFRGGAKVASGDIDGDGIYEIITGAGKGGRAHIRVFDKAGNVKSQFFAYDKNFFGGVNVAAGDTDGDGEAEIITAPISGGGPHIRIFNAGGVIKGQFFAFEKEFHGGANIEAADINNNGETEIIVSKSAGENSEIKIFDPLGNEKLGFIPFVQLKGGVNVGAIYIH